MIKKVKWNNDPILGNLELNLLKPDGTAYNTIVLAGENGTGKTTILNTLASFLNGGSFLLFNYIEYNVGNNIYSIAAKSSKGDTFIKNKQLESGYHYRQNTITLQEETIIKTKNNYDNQDIRYYGCIYSRARSGFSTRSVDTVKTSQLDNTKYDTDNNDDFTSIKQLFVDISSQDALDWVELSKKHSSKTYDDFVKISKMFRFQKSFNDFFDNIQFEGVQNNNNKNMKIMFNKNGSIINIDGLSTGEKQIVFRGASLLRNNHSINNGIVFVDEPELSMHPHWQEKIFDYYKNLFIENGKQTVQMFFATHSEAVLRSALNDPNALVIVLKNNSGVITAEEIKAPKVLPTLTSSEINYLAFGIPSVDYHIALYGYLQSSKSLDTVKDADTFVKNHALYNPALHEKRDSFTNSRGITTNYETLPTFIRNSIDHPSPSRIFTKEEMVISIELLQKIVV